MDLRELQTEHHDWQRYNFPDQVPYQALLGAMEELGELAHAHLKASQHIREYDEVKFKEEAVDAIGDLLIFLAGYCNGVGIDFQFALEYTWEKVRQRDWQKNPGGEDY